MTHLLPVQRVTWAYRFLKIVLERFLENIQLYLVKHLDQML